MAFTATSIRYQPSEVIWAPTTLTGSSPFGGTVLGYTADGVRLRIKTGRVVVKGEESGEEILDTIYTGMEVVVTVVMQQWDDGVLPRAFPGGLTSATYASSSRVLHYPGTLIKGSRGTSNSGILLIAPLDTTNNRIILLRNAIPLVDESADLAWRLRDPTKIPMIFYAVEDSTIASTNARYNSRTMFVGLSSDTTI